MLAEPLCLVARSVVVTRRERRSTLHLIRKRALSGLIFDESSASFAVTIVATSLMLLYGGTQVEVD